MNEEISVDSEAVRNQPKYYSLGSVIALYVFAYVAAYASHGISGYAAASPLGLLVPILFVALHRPSVFALSRWRPTVFHVLLGAGVGYLLFVCAVQLKLLLSPYSVATIRAPDYVFAVVAATVLMPVIEEVFFRGVLQSSLQERIGPLLAIAFVAVLAALGHRSFWIALPGQFGLGCLFAITRRSIPASIVCHATMNTFVVVSNVGFVVAT